MRRRLGRQLCQAHAHFRRDPVPSSQARWTEPHHLPTVNALARGGPLHAGRSATARPGHRGGGSHHPQYRHRLALGPHSHQCHQGTARGLCMGDQPGDGARGHALIASSVRCRVMRSFVDGRVNDGYQPLAVIGAFRGCSDRKNFWKNQRKRALKLSALLYIATSPNRAAICFVFLGRLYLSSSSLRLYCYK